jgi:acetyltransferase-like isoleucine patch superfamily enzyme
VLTLNSTPQRFKGLLVTLSLRLSGARVGRRMRIEGSIPITRNLGTMELGDDIKFRIEGSARTALRTGALGTLQIGDDTYINEGTCIVATKRVTIGSHCLIGDNVQIHDSDYHQLEQFAAVRILPITIGKNVWIGRNVIILPGVTIGEHSVIGAGSVVTRSVPERMVYAGIPAKKIREITADDNFVRR